MSEISEIFEGNVSFDPMNRDYKVCPYCEGHGKVVHGVASDQPERIDCMLCDGDGEIKR